MATDFNGQWKNARTATDEAESVRTLTKILSSKEGRTFVFNLDPQDATFCIEILDHVSPLQSHSPPPILPHLSDPVTQKSVCVYTSQGLTKHQLHGAEKQKFFATLRRLAGKHARLPQSMVITDKIEYSSNQPQKSGGFADIKPGRYRECDVAVKVLRVAKSDNFEKIRKVSGKRAFFFCLFCSVNKYDALTIRDQSMHQQFCKEVILWNSLSHPNVLKLKGVVGDMEQYQFATVSEWMMHGNIMEYIRKNATNRLELVGVSAFRVQWLHRLTFGDSYVVRWRD